MTDHLIRRVIKSSRLWGLLFLISFTACNRGLVFEDKHELADHRWHKDSLAVFAPEIEDTSKVVNIGFTLQHNNNYPYSNMWLFVDVKGPEGQLQTDTMEFFLAEPDGRWLGQGNDDSRSVNWLYKPGVKLRNPGSYEFSVRQGMRRDVLEGVHSLSLWIEEAEQKEGLK